MPPLPFRQFWIPLHDLAERPAVRRKLATPLIVLGALLRLRQFFEVRSFWGDEAMLALNLSVYDFGDLLSKPLAFDQIAPIGFLLLCKAASVVLGVNELAFRMTPLMFGLAVPFLAYRVGNQIFHNNRWSVLAFTAFFAFSPILIYYSNELKPYGLDVFFTLACLHVYHLESHPESKLTRLWIVGLIALTFSYTSCFVLAAIGSHAWVRAVRRSDKRQSLRIVLISTSWMTFFALLFLLFYRSGQSNERLSDYWRSGFLPADFLDWPLWLGESLASLPHMTIFQDRPVSIHLTRESLMFPNLIIVGLLVPLIATKFPRRNSAILIIGLALTINILVAKFGWYPFRARTILYLSPLVFFIFGSGIDAFLKPTKSWIGIIAIVGTAFTLATQTTINAKNLIHPTHFSDLKSVLSYIETNREGDDEVVVSRVSFPAFLFYAKAFGLGDHPPRILPRGEHANNFLHNPRNNGRIWFVFSQRMDEAFAFEATVSEGFSILANLEINEAACYLVELSEPSEGRTLK